MLKSKYVEPMFIKNLFSYTENTKKSINEAIHRILNEETAYEVLKNAKSDALFIADLILTDSTLYRDIEVRVVSNDPSGVKYELSDNGIKRLMSQYNKSQEFIDNNKSGFVSSSIDEISSIDNVRAVDIDANLSLTSTLGDEPIIHNNKPSPDDSQGDEILGALK